MKYIGILLSISLILSISGVTFNGDAYARSDDGEENTAGSALGSAVLGGLLGAGLGAAIGSASGKAGTGAAIGAGVGAVGGTLVGASQEKKRRQQEEEEAYMYEREAPVEDEYAERPAPSTRDVKAKKRIIREYDADGNVVSEKEVKE